MTSSSFSRSLPSTVSVLFLVCCLVGSAWATSQQDEPIMIERFHRWMELHGKSYPTIDEKLRRFETYRRNVEHIEATNQEGKLSYMLGENQLTDLTDEEVLAMLTPPEMNDEYGDDKSMMITTHVGDVAEGHPKHGTNLSALPESFDWRTMGAVTPVKNQGMCESCWAFAAVAAVESAHQILTGQLVSLSEQELVDCLYGCRPGFTKPAITWITQNGGITTEHDYPYTGVKGICDKSKLNHHNVTVNFSRVVVGNEQNLMAAVVEQPVIVMIKADVNFVQYQGGLFSGPCGLAHNHYVVIVGYGEDLVTRKKYWIVKNSFGELWGEHGYIFMEREIGDFFGLCGLTMHALYPIV